MNNGIEHEVKMKSNGKQNNEACITEPFQIGRLISMLYRAGVSFFTYKAEPFDLAGGQMGLIFYLSKHDGVSQDELSRILEVDKATVTRAIHKLEQINLVKRRRDANDHRVNRVYITEEGQSLQHGLGLISKEWQNILLNDFSKEEIDQLEFLFNKLSNNARAYKSTLNKKSE